MRHSQSTEVQSTVSHCRLASPMGSDYSRMYSMVSSDWLPSYFKATLTVLEIFKMDEYYPESSRT
jgi:hypothetical protein